MRVSILAASAAAPDEKNEVTGIVSRTFISDPGLHGPRRPTINPLVRSGEGLSFEVNYSRRFLGTEVYAISVEVPPVFNLDEDLPSGGDIVPTDYKQSFVTPAVRLSLFSGTRVSPWRSFGGGFGHFSEST
jgi:hypothetical protein